jgi:anti-sigma factor RsiW
MIDPRRIMQFYDGELDPREADAVRRLIERDPSARCVLDGFGDVSAAIHSWAEDGGRTAAPAPWRGDRALERPRPRAQAVVWMGAAAAAAVMALASTATDTFPGASAPRAPLASASHAAPVSASVESAPSDDGSEATGAAIEVVDFGSGSGTIFVVSKGAQATPVVWLSDDPPERQAKSL